MREGFAHDRSAPAEVWYGAVRYWTAVYPDGENYFIINSKICSCNVNVMKSIKCSCDVSVFRVFRDNAHGQS